MAEQAKPETKPPPRSRRKLHAAPEFDPGPARAEPSGVVHSPRPPLAELASRLDKTAARVEPAGPRPEPTIKRSAESLVEAERLEARAELERQHPGPGLVDALLSLADYQDDPLPTLHEAAILTAGLLGNPRRARAICERVFTRASTRWVSGDVADAERLEWFTTWALDELVRAAMADKDYEAAIELLVDASWLPFSRSKAGGLIRQAAAIAERDLRDPERAAELTRLEIERNVEDTIAT